ncbi:hypothetical protein I4U23_003565 [Adineta vaga]|nr:hypothetical protein I4U23_003565 [Adineta vaga]
MSNYLTPSIEILPVEILHSICDNLDAQTIFYSIRPLSRFFRSVVHSYNRCELDFSLISKSNFYFFCRCIHPENIVSLTLSNDSQLLNQIDLFISLVHLQHISRLRSLTLFHATERQVNHILKSINLEILNTLSCQIRKSSSSCSNTTVVPTLLTVLKTALRQLEFKAYYTSTASETSWSVKDIAALLTTDDRMNVDDLRKILQCSSYLSSLNISDVPFGNVTHSNSNCFRQITSLTFTSLSITIDRLELFLSLTPLLTDLKLIGGNDMLNGKRWEDFIQINLSHLNKFEFYFRERRSVKPTINNLKFISNSFKTPFWTEYKKWFVVCEYEHHQYGMNFICLYSIPICISFINYPPASQKESLITSNNDDILTNNNIESLTLTLNSFTADIIQQKRGMINRPLFPNVNEINLEFHAGWPQITLNSLFEIINLSRLVHVKISGDYRSQYTDDLLMEIKQFLQKTSNLISLTIHSSFYKYRAYLIANHLLSIIPRQLNICKFQYTISIKSIFSLNSVKIFQSLNLKLMMRIYRQILSIGLMIIQMVQYVNKMIVY